MKAYKEIGDIIREKVDSAEDRLEAPLWDKIETTLIKKKKKTFFYNWSLNVFIALFSIVGLYAITT